MNTENANIKLYLAPVKGITDRVYRTVFAACFIGIDKAYAPFITASDSDKKIRDLSPAVNSGMITIPQILTKSADTFITLALKLKDSGCDEINLNLGCPFQKVLDRGEGAALLSSPEAVDRFLDKIFSSGLSDISIKMRLGMNNPDEIIPLIEIMNNYPVKEIIVHARTADQMYEGEVNISAFSDAQKLSKHDVLYNGDIRHKSDIDYLNEKTGFPGRYMIGRGLLINPFLAEEIKSGCAIADDTKIIKLKSFTDRLLKAYESELQSPAHVLDKMKGVWSYLSQSFDTSHKIEKKIRKAGSIRHYSDEVKRIFDQNPVIAEAIEALPRSGRTTFLKSRV